MIKRLSLVTAIGLLVIGGGPALGVEKLTIGNAKVVVRTVTGELQADQRTIKLLDDIYHNELIETGESSATELIFLDQTKLALGPNSRLVLDRFVFDPNPNKASFVVTAAAGVFRFASGNLPKKSYTIRTPTATIGIRGTVFSVVVIPADPDGYRDSPVVNVTVEQGVAYITGCKGEQVSLDRSGLSTTISVTADGTCTAPSAPGVQPAKFTSILSESLSSGR